MTLPKVNITLPKVILPQTGIPIITLQGVVWVQEEMSHIHDYVGNWLWDDGGCILWDDGLVIAL